MRVRRVTQLAVFVAAAALVAAGWYLGSPLFIRTTRNEPVPTLAIGTSRASLAPGATPLAVISAEALTSVIARGELQYVDSLHNGKGAVVVMRVGVRHFLRFEDVAITNAPDVHVYLSRETGGTWSESSSLYLGPLKATDGAFNYEIAAGTDLSPYRSVVVWCRAFSVLVTWADLQPA